MSGRFKDEIEGSNELLGWAFALIATALALSLSGLLGISALNHIYQHLLDSATWRSYTYAGLSSVGALAVYGFVLKYFSQLPFKLLGAFFAGAVAYAVSARFIAPHKVSDTKDGIIAGVVIAAALGGAALHHWMAREKAPEARRVLI